MEARAHRRFAVGPFSSAERAAALGVEPPPVPQGQPGWDLAPHALVVAEGIWLCTDDPVLRDHAASALDAVDHVVVTIDCWCSLVEDATLARFRIERHRGGEVETEHADRRYPDLARAGVLPAIAADWLAQKVRSIARPAKGVGPTKKEAEQRARADRFLAHLAEHDALELAAGSTLADLADRTRRILFVVARSRREARPALHRMFSDSKHVARGPAAEDALDRALDAIRYRR